MAETAQLMMQLDTPESAIIKRPSRKHRCGRYIKGGEPDSLPMSRDTAIKVVNDCKLVIYDNGRYSGFEPLRVFAAAIKAKREDELRTAIGSPYAFQRRPSEPPAATAMRLSMLEESLTDVEDWTLVNLAEILGPVSVTRTATDLLGIACEAFSDTFSKRMTGQFFTPREIVDFTLALVKPHKGETVLDPACGTGGFLIAGADLVHPTDLYGIELNMALADVAGLNLEIHGGRRENITSANTLLDGIEGQYDVIVANPPFGVSVRDHHHNYELARRGKFKSEVGFVERIHSLLKPGGRAAIILPNGLLSNMSVKYVRDWIMERFQVLAVVSLPSDTFSHYGTSVKTSVLLLRRFAECQSTESVGDYPIFMAIAEDVGYDRRGRETSQATLIIQPDGSAATLVRCGDLLDYIVDDNGKQAYHNEGSTIIGRWNKFLRDPDSFLTK